MNRPIHRDESEHRHQRAELAQAEEQELQLADEQQADHAGDAEPSLPPGPCCDGPLVVRRDIVGERGKTSAYLPILLRVDRNK